MTFQEKEIPKKRLPQAIKILDLDEGIRIENESSIIFVNKIARRYCIKFISKEVEQFKNLNEASDVLKFVYSTLTDQSKIFLY